jgi:glycine oxidase
MEKSVLVVGSGLAGLTLAYHLQKSGAQVTIVDDGVNHSSRVAAGMINPIVFRRVNKGWRVDEFIPYLQAFYRELESVVGASFFHPVQIRRLFSNEHERELWLKKQALPEYESFLSTVTPEDDAYDRAINNFGSGRVKQAAYVKTDVFLDSIREWMRNKCIVLNEAFDFSELTGLSYKGTQYDDLVFCEGYRGKDNPFFGDLPLNQTKGETLVIKASFLPEDESVNRKCFILPMGDHHFKVGSTYEWSCTDLSITDKGREQILEKVSYLTTQSVEVVEQEAGIRPTTEDRRPLMGTHHTHEHYHIFNGLGTKGYLLAPKLASEMAHYILGKGNLNPEATIERFYRKR